ncbi:hypothetical protein ABH930_000294 [Kitasatospora sp. GAS204A]|uniref:hypothetical protein n=1 Tax=unclassified Kitasatospora TaxID=2633591 RepID=UPI0024771E9D|nr:hypothetical protein [Kitasatospora sp. GAS204B]MDH6116875.1 hypothetical protein [Kitasatospora sp. GAS204B]
MTGRFEDERWAWYDHEPPDESDDEPPDGRLLTAAEALALRYGRPVDTPTDIANYQPTT